MISTFLSLYLIFIILATIFFGYLILKFKVASPRSTLAFLLALIVLPLVFGYFYVAYFDSLPEVVVPDVNGMPLEMAKQKIESAGLQVREAGKIFEIKFTEGSVVSQRPEGGRRAKAGRVVNLMVSSGKKKVPTPNLLGRSIAQAETVLAAAGLKLGEVKREGNKNAADGTILAQEPLPGEEADASRGVDLIISTTEEVSTND